MTGVQFVTDALIAEVLEKARQSPRRRMNHNFHESMEANPHRFLNVLLERTYIQPHRHTDPPKAESFLVLEGQVAFVLFDDAGNVVSTHILGRGEIPSTGIGIDVAAGVWHTITAVTPYAVCYEVKPGPYSPSTDKDFAPWAPRENAPEAQAYLESLLRELRRLALGNDRDALRRLEQPE